MDMRALNWIVRGLFPLVLMGLVASAAAGATVKRDMSKSHLAEVKLTSRLDLGVIEEVGGIVDNVSKDVARVYLLPEDTDQLRARGFSVIWIRDQAVEYGKALWERTRHTRNPLDAYHTNDEIAALFASWQAAYPTYFSYQSLGLSAQGRNIWACKVSDNVSSDEAEIEVKYIANMHGDEVVGKENCLRFIEELLTQRDTVPAYQELMSDFEMWFIPCMNPDGLANVSRYNGNGADLNRDFPDRCDDSVNTTTGREPETAAVMNWSATHHFITSANFHGGSLVTNYPWDNNCSGGAVYAPTPEDSLFVWISRRYCEANPRMRVNTAFLYPDTGITNGADWYEVSGGMQDWNYVWMGDREVTIELDNTKWPDTSRLESLWQENRLAMRYYFLEAKYGVRGVVTDSTTGLPLAASIQLFSIPYLTFSGAFHGEYYRMLRPGSYTLTFSAPGYASKTFTNVTVPPDSYTVLDVALPEIGTPNISVSPDSVRAELSSCTYQDVPFSIINSGSAALVWSSGQEPYSQQTHYGNAVGGGYRWIDSDQPNGPAYQWKDISLTGTPVTFAADDENLGPFDIGFAFPFYGQNFTTYHICSNGWISFTSTSVSYSNRDLPYASGPRNLLAAWWDDLSPQRTGAQVRRWTNNADSLVVSFVDVPDYRSEGLYDFEFILLSSGKFAFEYRDMGPGRLTESTIGWQDTSGTKGEAMIYNAAYIHNEMAISFCPNPLVGLVPASGIVNAYSTEHVVARVHSCCLPFTAQGLFPIASNDPDTDTLWVFASMEIPTIPPAPVNDLVAFRDGDAIRIVWSPTSLASGYLVYRMTSAQQDYLSGELLTPAAIPDTTYLDTNWPAGNTRYFYQVTAVR
jgi:hypothetical protein